MVISKLFKQASGAIVAGIVALTWANAETRAALLDGKVMSADLFHMATSDGNLHIISSGDFVVGPGVELEGFGYREFSPPLPALVDIDISDRQVLITLLIDQPFAFTEFFRIQDARDTIDHIANIFINPATNWAGIEPIRIDTTGNAIEVNVSRLAGLAGQQILLDLVPEPASAALAVGGLLGLLVVRQRRKRVRLRRTLVGKLVHLSSLFDAPAA